MANKGRKNAQKQVQQNQVCYYYTSGKMTKKTKTKTRTSVSKKAE